VEEAGDGGSTPPDDEGLDVPSTVLWMVSNVGEEAEDVSGIGICVLLVGDTPEDGGRGGRGELFAGVSDTGCVEEDHLKKAIRCMFLMSF
jgi:hypothetical protein